MSGGGSGSGAIEYPQYLEDVHMEWLEELDDKIDRCEDGTVPNPYEGVIAFDPDDWIQDIWDSVCALNAAVDAIDPDADWTTYLSHAATRYDADVGRAFTFNSYTPDAYDDIDTYWRQPSPAADTAIAADVAAFEDIQDDRLTTTVLPRFQAGMLNANACLTSSFVIGQAVLEGFNSRDVAMFQSDLRFKAFLQADQIRATDELTRNSQVAEAHRLDDELQMGNTEHRDKINFDLEVIRNQLILKSAEIMLDAMLKRAEWQKLVAHYTIVGRQIAIQAKIEELDKQVRFDDLETRWMFDIWTYGGNMIAALSGGVTYPQAYTPSTAQSVVGGALSGASIGSSISGYGAVIGAVVGGVAGYLSNS